MGGVVLPSARLCRQSVLDFPIPLIKKLLLSPYQACSVKGMRICHGSSQRRAGISVARGPRDLTEEALTSEKWL